MRRIRCPLGSRIPRARSTSPPGSRSTASPVRLHAARYVLAAKGPTTACRTTSIVRPPPEGSVRERGAAAARRAGVRVVELEPGALQADDVVDGDALQVH